jgi:single-strand DNA-binding protein
MYNKFFLIGNLGHDPQVHQANGGTFATFRFATNKRWTDKDGVRHEEATWHDCVLWRNDLTNFLDKARKGACLFLEGEICYREDDQQGGHGQRAFLRVNEWRPAGATPAPIATEAEPASDDDAEQAEAAVA